jgi:hypothetical protein
MAEPLDLDAIETYARDAGPGTIQSAAAAHMLRRSVPALIAECRALAASIQRVRDLHVAMPARVPPLCRDCRTDWPCPTLRALDAGESPVPEAPDA